MAAFRRCLVLALCTIALARAFDAAALPHFAGPPTVRASLFDASGEAVAVDRGGMTAYVANASLDRVTIIDQTMRLTSVQVGRTPRFIAASATGSGTVFFTSNAGDNTVSIGTSTRVVNVPIGGFGPIAVNGATGRAYVLRGDGIVVAVDAASATTSSFDTGLRAPVGHAFNQAGNRLYVADASGEVRVFDITAVAPAQAMESFRVPGRPAAIAAGLDPRLYVLSDASGGTITEINLSSNGVQSFAMPGGPQEPRALVASGSVVIAGFANELVIFDLVTHNVDLLRPGAIRGLEYDSQSGLAFAVGDGFLFVTDPRTLESYTLPVAASSTQVRFIYKTCDAFVAGSPVTVVHAPCGDDIVGGIRAHALWWVPEGRESGWGLNVAHHGSVLFTTWFTYDANGQPTWLVMSNGRDTNKNGYLGTLYRTTGPAFSAAAFDPSKVTRTAVGDMEIQVGRVDVIAMRATVDGAVFNRTLARQLFSWPVPYCDSGLAAGSVPIYQDLWWNPNESGWGLNVAHQGNILFVTWFTYDTDGKATWFVGSNIEKTGNATYSGTLYKTFGPPMTASPWDPTKVTRMPVGDATLTFADDDHGTFAYTVSGISGSKAITRQLFASPVTRCR